MIRLRFVFAGAVLLLLAGAAIAQDRPAAITPNTIYVGADGKFEAPPDTALVQFAIAVQDPDQKTAYDRARKAAEQVREVLRSNGFDPKQAEIGGLQVQPVYDYKTSKRKLVGYRVSSSISVKVRDFTKVPTLADAFSNMDVTDTQSISYKLENIDEAKARAVEDAYRHAHDSALALARACGRTVGELTYASVDTFEPGPRPPMPMRATAMKAEAAPTEGFSTEKITVTAHVNALFAMK